MSISDAINNAKNKINNAYNALEAKGATMPSSRTLEYMKSTIESIPTSTSDFKSTLALLNGWGGTIKEDTLLLQGTSIVGDVSVPNVDGLIFDGKSAFKNNTNISNVSLNNVPFVNNNMAGAFSNCYNLMSVTGINQNVTNMATAFKDCSKFNQNIQIPNSVGDLTAAFDGCSVLNPSQVINIPDSVTYMTYAFRYCDNLNQDVQIPNSITSLQDCFRGCESLDKNIQVPYTVNVLTNTFAECYELSNVSIHSPNVNSFSGIFLGTNKSKNVYIPFRYVSGALTPTYNSFNNSTSGINGKKGVTLRDLSIVNGSLVMQGWNGIQTSNYMVLHEFSGTESSPQIPSDRNVYFDGSVFRNNQNVVAVDLRNIPFFNGNMSSAFWNCQNLTSVSNINPSITNMATTFAMCQKLKQGVQVPDSVEYMDYTFAYCSNFSQPIQIPSTAQSLGQTFDGCTNFSDDVIVYSNKIYNARGIFNNTSLSKNIYIPFKYSNGINSATFNSFVSAGYLTSAGVSTGRNGVTVHDLQ